MRVVILKSNHPSVNPQMVGEAKQREDGSYEVTFQNLKHDMPGMAKAEQDVTIWFPKSYVKKLK